MEDWPISLVELSPNLTQPGTFRGLISIMAFLISSDKTGVSEKLQSSFETILGKKDRSSVRCEL